MVKFLLVIPTVCLALSGLARAEQTGVTRVTEEPRVTVNMGITMAPTLELSDSVRWSLQREEGWKRSQAVALKFPRAKSLALENYLHSLVVGFRKILTVPRSRSHFYVADSLNAALWPAGGGFFVVHSGLLRYFRDERQFAFLVALELAHDALGHNRDLNWKETDFDSWPVEFWAILVGRDPIERTGFSYTLQQESDALELVSLFFRTNNWNYEAIRERVSRTLDNLKTIQELSSLPMLHKNFAMAVKLPHRVPKAGTERVVGEVNAKTYARAIEELAQSSLQGYPWMLELAPYRDVAVVEDIKKIGVGFLDRNELITVKLAQSYMRGLLLFKEKKWKDMIINAESALELASGSEPFLWQRAIARQQLLQFNRCAAEMLKVRWQRFDHRRELLSIECSFLEGRYTEAEGWVSAYRSRYAYDIEGAFWQNLIAFKMRKPFEPGLAKMRNFWGRRGYVRALEVFYYGALGKRIQAQDAIEVYPLTQPTLYTTEELGILTFANVWFKESYAEHFGDDRVPKLQAEAESQWRLARLIRSNLPRQAVTAH